jgi:hypothetical protein
LERIQPMQNPYPLSAAFALTCLLAAGAPARAESAAERLNDEAKAILQAADARFAADQAQCYERFQVNRCLDQAKEARLEAVRRARALQAEARRLKLAERQQRVAERGTQAGAAAIEPAAPTSAPQPALIDPAAQTVRQQRAAEGAQRQAEADAARAQKDAERAAQRAEAEAAAAKRAEKAARDRARYEEKIRRHEAPKQ